MKNVSTSESRKRKLSVSDGSQQSKATASTEFGILVELCERESIEIIQRFVRAGADVNAPDDIGLTPLHVACTYKRLDVVKFLLESGADVRQVDNEGKTALELVSSIYRYTVEYPPEIIMSLLEHDSTPNTITDIILTSAASCGHIEIAKLLLDRRAPGSDTKPIWVALRNACRQSRVNFAKLLLQHGATFAEADADLSKPSCLYMAVDSNAPNCLEMVTLIVDNGADTYGEPSKLTSAFWRACDTGKGKVEVIKLLLARGADINTTGNRGLTLLLRSCRKGRIDIFKLLLANGADPNIAFDNGTTPLMLAALYMKYNRIKPLLEAGADVTAVDDEGKSVLDYLEGKAELLELCKLHVEKNRPSLKPLLK